MFILAAILLIPVVMILAFTEGEVRRSVKKAKKRAYNRHYRRI